MRYEVVGGADEHTTAAILAVIARFDEETASVASIPKTAPRQSLWVMSGRPRPVQRPFATQEPAAAPGWSVGGADDLEVSE